MVHWENLLPMQLSVWLHTLAHANIVSYINFGYNYGINSIVLAYKLDQLVTHPSRRGIWKDVLFYRCINEFESRKSLPFLWAVAFFFAVFVKLYRPEKAPR